jgi:4-hydroxy-tetrahydrodipicolinate reductase
MFRVSVLGATGRVGSVLLDAIADAPDLALAEAISGNGSAASVTLAEARLDDADAIVDFSNPAACMALLDRLAGNPVPVVIGTTGFDSGQAERLKAEAAFRPILVGANFTKGFEAFAAAGSDLAENLPDARLTVGEIYNENKKPVMSGTTQRLCNDLGKDGRPVQTDIARIGDTPGVNSITLDYGVATITITLNVHSRAAYAAGAIDAVRWLISRPSGFYQPKDTLSD